MIEAWLSASLTTASSGPSSVSNSPPLASKQLPYRIVSSVCRKPLILSSSVLWIVCVPQMNRTLAMPNPYSSSPRRAASMTSGCWARPR